jgi:membrane protease YdiL (CAAX protease family)
MRIRKNALLLYFALAFGISWSGFVLATERDNLYLMLAAMVLGPTGTALALTSAFEGRRGLRELAHRLFRWRVGARWYALVLVAPALLAVELAALSLVSPKFLPAIVSGPGRAAIVGDALIIGLGAGIWEEIGWTGFVTPRLLQRYSPFAAGLVLGVPWALWHALPDYLGRSMPPAIWVLHMLQWMIALVAFRVFMTWIYGRSHSLLLAMLLHAGFTGGQRLLWPLVPPEAELIWYGLFTAALWAVVAIVALAQRGRTLMAVSSSRECPG